MNFKPWHSDQNPISRSIGISTGKTQKLVGPKLHQVKTTHANTHTQKRDEVAHFSNNKPSSLFCPALCLCLDITTTSLIHSCHVIYSSSLSLTLHFLVHLNTVVLVNTPTHPHTDKDTQVLPHVPMQGGPQVECTQTAL